LVAKEKVDQGDPPRDTAESILKLTVAANLMAAGSPEVNAYKERNAVLEARRKARVFYDRKTGLTRPGYSAEHLRYDCERRSNESHADSLARTIKNDTKVAKPTGIAAHHVVASRDPDALPSRLMLFGWGIGINDADNGLYLPCKGVPRPKGLKKATLHDYIHTYRYHYAVNARLIDVDETDTAGARVQLKAMKREILADQFPYRKLL